MQSKNRLPLPHFHERQQAGTGLGMRVLFDLLSEVHLLLLAVKDDIEMC